MAFTSVKNEELDPNKDLGSTPDAGAGALPPMDQGAPQTPQAQPQAPVSSPRTKGSGSFTNLSKYLRAGQGAGQRVAQAVTGGLQKKADVATSKLGATQKTFGAQMEAGSLKNRDLAGEQAKQRAMQAAGGQVGQTGVYPAPTPAPVEGQPVPETPAPVAPVAPVLTPEQQAIQQQVTDAGPIADERMAAILNAQYKGPMALGEATNYGQTATAFDQARQRAEQAKTYEGRKGLVREQFTGGGRQYTRGQSLLDSMLLNRDKAAVESITGKGQELGQLGGRLEEARTQALRDITGRQEELTGIRSQAKADLQGIAGARSGEVEGRLEELGGIWGDVAEHYQGALSGGSPQLSGLEAAVLEAKGGQGLYTQKVKDLIRAKEFEKAKSISESEFGQLGELERLARLSEDYGVADSGLDFASDYKQEELAGTQGIEDVLDTERFGRRMAGAEKDFRRQAGHQITGYGQGKAKYKKGWMRGRGNVKKTHRRKTTLKDMMKGYDFTSPVEVTKGRADILGRMADMSPEEKAEFAQDPTVKGLLDIETGRHSRSEYDMTEGGTPSLMNFASDTVDRMEDGTLKDVLNKAEELAPEIMAGGLYGKVAADTTHWAGDTSGKMVDDLEVATKGLGKAVGLQGIVDPVATATADVAKYGTDAVKAVGKGLQDVIREGGSLISNITGSGKSKARKKAKAQAKRRSLRNLQKNINKKIVSTGVKRRLGVADNAATAKSTQKLQDILSKIQANIAKGKGE